MNKKETKPIQNIFLEGLMEKKIEVMVYLVNGVKLQGQITLFDNFTIMLKRAGHSQIIFKHAISTILPKDADANVMSY